MGEADAEENEKEETYKEKCHHHHASGQCRGHIPSNIGFHQLNTCFHVAADVLDKIVQSKEF